jgi:phage tail sheath protein FI
MPTTVTYPGVYIEEIPSGVRTITGVATSITAFIGRALRGDVNEPTVINNFGDFERFFGGLDVDYPLSYAVQDFFNNGGAQAIIVRLFSPYFADDAASENALHEAKTAADDVNTAATDAAADPAATADSVATAAEDEVATAGSASSVALAAAQAVAAAARAEASKDPYVTTTQTLQISGDPTDGTITLAFNDEETTPISLGDLANADPVVAQDAVKNALEALSSVGTGHGVTVVRSGTAPNNSFTITTDGTVLSPESLTVTNSLTGGTPDATITAPLPDANSVAAAATAAAGSDASTNGPAVFTAVFNRALIILGDLILEAANPGAWGNSLEITVDHDTKTDDDGNADETLFNLTIIDPVGGNIEKIRNVSGEPDAVRLVSRVLPNESSLVQVVGTPPASRPAEGDYEVDSAWLATDSAALGASDYLGSQDNKTGLYALEKADLFNLLCIPADTREGNTEVTVYQEALTYCTGRRAMLLVDSPAEWAANPDTAAAKAIDGLSDLGLVGTATRNAALFFPRIEKADIERESQIDTFVPCGAMAGIFARTDSTRGVWKAPAGTDAAIYGISGLQATLTDAENGQLNPLGINCLRLMTLYGPIVWGARTLRGADAMADEYKYIPVRRTALFIEESLYRGTQWVVFEPNDEPLWAQIRLNVGAFMHTLFRQGAFQGSTPSVAYFVKCDSETTTQTDRDSGIVNILVGFAPLKPAEFVIIKIQQMAGEIET